MSTVFVSFPAQRTLLYHNTDTEVKGNIWEKKAGCSKNIIKNKSEKVRKLPPAFANGCGN